MVDPFLGHDGARVRTRRRRLSLDRGRWRGPHFGADGRAGDDDPAVVEHMEMQAACMAVDVPRELLGVNCERLPAPASSLHGDRSKIMHLGGAAIGGSPERELACWAMNVERQSIDGDRE